MINYIFCYYKYKSINLLEIERINNDGKKLISSYNYNFNHNHENTLNTNTNTMKQPLNKDEHKIFKQHVDFLSNMLNLESSREAAKINLNILKDQSKELNVKDEFKKIENIIELNTSSMNNKKTYDLFHNYYLLVVKIAKKVVNNNTNNTNNSNILENGKRDGSNSNAVRNTNFSQNSSANRK